MFMNYRVKKIAKTKFFVFEKYSKDSEKFSF